eukprot:758107_1
MWRRDGSRDLDTMNVAPAQKYTQKELKNWPPASLFPLMANDFPVALDTPRKLGNIKNDLKQLTANEISQLVYPGETHARRRFKAPWEENRNVKVWRCKPVADMIKQSLSRKIVSTGGSWRPVQNVR